MATFIVVVDADPHPSAVGTTPLAAAMHQGFGEEYILAYLRRKMPAGSPVNIVSAHEVGVETVLTDEQENVLLKPNYKAPHSVYRSGSRRDDDPVHAG